MRYLLAVGETQETSNPKIHSIDASGPDCRPINRAGLQYLLQGQSPPRKDIIPLSVHSCLCAFPSKLPVLLRPPIADVYDCFSVVLLCWHLACGVHHKDCPTSVASRRCLLQRCRPTNVPIHDLCSVTAIAGRVFLRQGDIPSLIVVSAYRYW